MQKLEIMRIHGAALALEPISHGEILPMGEKSNITPFRKLPFLCDSGRLEVYAVSGNSLRAVSHRMLWDEMIDALGVNFDDLIKNEADRRRVSFFLRVGGLTGEGTKAQPIKSSAYVQLQDTIPTLGLYGGTYQGHNFESSCRVGFLIPIIHELSKNLKNIYAKSLALLGEDIAEAELPTLEDIKPGVIRYARKREAGYEENGDKEGGLYGCEALPTGTKFAHVASLTSDSDMLKKAFKAALALLARRGVIGGYEAKGHGSVLIKYAGVSDDDIKDFRQYVVEHKKEITEAISSIPNILKWNAKKSNKKGKEDNA